MLQSSFISKFVLGDPCCALLQLRCFRGSLFQLHLQFQLHFKFVFRIPFFQLRFEFRIHLLWSLNSQHQISSNMPSAACACAYVYTCVIFRSYSMVFSKYVFLCPVPLSLFCIFLPATRKRRVSEKYKKIVSETPATLRFEYQSYSRLRTPEPAITCFTFIPAWPKTARYHHKINNRRDFTRS